MAVKIRAMITGGGGYIAQAIAEELKKEGYSVFAPTHKELDVTDQLHVRKTLDIYKPNILVNCAGYIQPGTVLDQDIATWEKHIQVNLLGTYYCTKIALEQQCKTIINIASTSATKNKATWSAYCVSKSAIVHFTKCLVAENVDAYCVSPGRTRTKMRDRLFPNEDKRTLLYPPVIGRVVLNILEGCYEPGSDIVVERWRKP